MLKEGGFLVVSLHSAQFLLRNWFQFSDVLVTCDAHKIIEPKEQPQILINLFLRHFQAEVERRTQHLLDSGGQEMDSCKPLMVLVKWKLNISNGVEQSMDFVYFLNAKASGNSGLTVLHGGVWQ